MEKTRRHINDNDRYQIEILLNKGYIQVDIAKTLGFNKSAISNEIRRNQTKDGRYIAKVAIHKARVRRGRSKYQGMKIEKNPELKKTIIQMLIDRRSPDEIAGRMEREKLKVRIGTNAIYKWLYSVYGERYCTYLCTKRKKRKKQKGKLKRENIKDKIPLKLRPKRGNHAEYDTFVNKKKYQSKEVVCVVSDIKSKLFKGYKIPNLKPRNMVRGINTILGSIKIDTLTGDNGLENRYHQQFRVPSYFCDSYSPWQKPNVENNIGLVRRWFIPKNVDLSTLDQIKLDLYFDILNRKYRKSLNYKSAYEVALENGIIDEIPPKNY